MKKMKRILALIAAVLLIGLYASTIIFALIDSELTQNLLMASVAMTILLPILLYGIQLFLKLSKTKEDDSDSE